MQSKSENPPAEYEPSLSIFERLESRWGKNQKRLQIE
jgi:hypothetical protein